MNKTIVGIDISKKTFDASFIIKDKWKDSSFDNNPKGYRVLNEWLEEYGVTDAYMVMEATGRYWEALALFQHSLGVQISVVNPTRIKYHAKSKLSRTKSDKADARLIAEFASQNELRLWTPKSPAYAKLQEMTRCIENLTQDITRCLNRIEGGADEEVKDVYNGQIVRAQNEINKLRERVMEIINEDAYLSLNYKNLVSYKGVSHVVAVTILSEIPDIELFNSPKELTAYAGLNPAVKQSGTSVMGRGSISKMGSSRLRKALYMPALSARRFNEKLKTFGDGLKKRGKKPKLIIVACMRKMLEAIYWILKKQEPYMA